MRSAFGLIGLVVVLALVGLLVKKQMGSYGLGTAATGVPAAASSGTPGAGEGTVRQQGQQIQQQYKQAIEGALQQPRPTGDEK